MKGVEVCLIETHLSANLEFNEIELISFLQKLL